MCTTHSSLSLWCSILHQIFLKARYNQSNNYKDISKLSFHTKWTASAKSELTVLSVSEQLVVLTHIYLFGCFLVGRTEYYCGRFLPLVSYHWVSDGGIIYEEVICQKLLSQSCTEQGWFLTWGPTRFVNMADWVKKMKKFLREDKR